MPFIDNIKKQPNFFIPSNLRSIIYFFFPLETRDKFIKNCIDYEGEAVLVTVKQPILYFKNSQTEAVNIESTVFLGILVEFPYVAADSIGSQVIRILPLLSGYSSLEENKTEEQIKWIKKYTINNDSEGIIIPRSSIIHFCLYDKNIHSSLLEAHSPSN